MEYQGVDTATGKGIFHLGPIDDGTNNIGEFLALVHGLALLKKKAVNNPFIQILKQRWLGLEKKS